MQTVSRSLTAVFALTLIGISPSARAQFASLIHPQGPTLTDALGISGNNIVGYYTDGYDVSGAHTVNHGFEYTADLVSDVPEPSAYPMSALSMLGIGILGLRRRIGKM